MIRIEPAEMRNVSCEISPGRLSLAFAAGASIFGDCGRFLWRDFVEAVLTNVYGLRIAIKESHVRRHN